MAIETFSIYDVPIADATKDDSLAIADAAIAVLFDRYLATGKPFEIDYDAKAQTLLVYT